MSPAARRARDRGSLPADASALATAKVAAARGAAGPAAAAEPAGPLAPVRNRSWNGVYTTTSAPSDSTGAIGPDRYIEMTNIRFGIYDRTSNTPIKTGTLNALSGSASSVNVFDPQVFWDGQTQRFYYAMDAIVSSSSNFLNIGFSKTASPSSAADFCKYSLGFGSTFPDYPKLGDTADFFVVGSNEFSSGGSFIGAFASWLTKPAPGATCPAPSSFLSGTTGPLMNAGGTTQAFTPVPAQQTDDSSTGYIVSRPVSVPAGGASFLTVFRITKNANGTANIPTTGGTVTVPAYKIPANAAQPGTTFLLDTSDTRPTQAVSAVDPARAGKVALWTQHTVLGGAGAEVRWYEIDPVALSLFQSGKVSSASEYSFNGAISPDRRVGGGSSLFGSSMVMTFDQSSSTVFPRIRVVSKVGAGAQSTGITIRASTQPYVGFDCVGAAACRWGDYAAATPDPAAATGGTVGQVWITSQWTAGGTSTSQANWRTWNASVTP